MPRLRTEPAPASYFKIEINHGSGTLIPVMSTETASPVLQTFPLGAQWPTIDPFLFVAHHHDDYPAGLSDLYAHPPVAVVLHHELHQALIQSLIEGILREELLGCERLGFWLGAR